MIGLHLDRNGWPAWFDTMAAVAEINSSELATRRHLIAQLGSGRHRIHNRGRLDSVMAGLVAE